jgi:serine/threonine protein kinase/ABC-type phosphate/phosphonate transport system substrate-binding protein
MIAARQCPACGSSTPVDAPRGLCVECLMRLAEDPSPTRTEGNPIAAENGPGAGRFGDYELLRQIGRGGMGVVYEARQISLNRIVALKMILGGDLASMSSSSVRRFKVEAEAAAKLDHPNIVAIHEFGEHDGLPFFSMQRIDGKCLDGEIASLAVPSLAAKSGGKDSEKMAAAPAQVRIAKLVATLARALHYAHGQGVIHCDVKPSNILIDGDGEPHLTDFGIARLLDQEGQLTKSGVIGSPRYMSPEQASGRRGEVTAATDIYGLGVVLYELLTGKPPFRAVTPGETLRQVMEQEPPAPHDSHPLVNRDLSIICLKCLEKNVRHRYASAAELADDLERWIRHEPILARRASPVERLARWCQRKPAIAALAASVALLLMAVAVLSAMLAWNLSEKGKNLETALEGREAALEGREALLVIGRTELIRKLEDLWKSKEVTSITITSEERLFLTGDNPRRPDAFPDKELRLCFGVYAFKKPIDMAMEFAPRLTAIEAFMTSRLGRPVLIDCRIYNSYDGGQKGLSEGVDFMRVGPSSYLSMKDSVSGISLLVVEEDLIRCVIFARADSGITSLSQLKGRSFAFGDPNSTFGNKLAKVALLEALIHLGDLKKWYHFRSHDEVVEAVMDSVDPEYDAGSANTQVLRRYDPSMFNVIYDFPNDLSMPMPFVAKEGLDTTVAKALKDALLAEHLKSSAAKATGYREVTDEDYHQFELLRLKMKRAEQFDQR